MRTLIVNGGMIEEDFALDFLGITKEMTAEERNRTLKNKFDQIFGVDKGVEFLYSNEILPTRVIGDFDSIKSDVIDVYKEMDIPIDAFNPIKDDTDIEIALRLAKEENANQRKEETFGNEEIVILGGTGTRLDHTLGTIYALSGSGLSGMIVDAHNRIRILEPGRYELKKSEQYGEYLSLLPIGGKAMGICLSGFRYNLTNGVLNCENTLGVSNRIEKELAVIEFTAGTLALIETRD